VVSIRFSVSAASSGRGGRPKKTDANNGDEDDAQNTHDGGEEHNTFRRFAGKLQV
jgi:hypothetical protein